MADAGHGVDRTPHALAGPGKEGQDELISAQVVLSHHAAQGRGLSQASQPEFGKPGGGCWRVHKARLAGNRPAVHDGPGNRLDWRDEMHTLMRC